MSTAPIRRPSTGVGTLAPRVMVREPEFPLETLFYTEKGGRECCYLQRTRFMKKYKRGEPMPKVFVLLGSDFRRVRDLLAWVGEGGIVEVWNGAADTAELQRVAKHYAGGDGLARLEVRYL